MAALQSIFLSTPSVRRATIDHDSLKAKYRKFLSTPSVRRATPLDCPLDNDLQISIHALREEGDIYRVSYQTRTKNFYPRPP